MKYGWLKALSASARNCRRLPSPKLKFFVSDRLTLWKGMWRRLSSVVGTVRKEDEEGRKKPVVSNARRGPMPYFSPAPLPWPAKLSTEVTSPA